MTKKLVSTITATTAAVVAFALLASPAAQGEPNAACPYNPSDPSSFTSYREQKLTELRAYTNDLNTRVLGPLSGPERDAWAASPEGQAAEAKGRAMSQWADSLPPSCKGLQDPSAVGVNTDTQTPPAVDQRTDVPAAEDPGINTGRVEEYDGNNVSPSCSDGIKSTYERYNITGTIVDNALALLSKRGIEGTAHEICALTASEPIEAVRALCRAGKSVFPADWAYAAIAKLGQNIESKDVERFGQSARDSFGKQCEFTRF